MDLHPSEYSVTDATIMKPSIVRDARLDRDSQADLHAAIDLAYAFSAAIKALHPIAEKQVKGMIFQGNLL
jgi:hypothetical protein